MEREVSITELPKIIKRMIVIRKTRPEIKFLFLYNRMRFNATIIQKPSKPVQIAAGTLFI